ncbi:hypothetical protein KI387_008605 [Taxus chinensis]|uniref:Uncharacterized protein n=1 Tax=Taxus chinensis TaxID=29808 RepID=A0AA38CQK9_TAXCH|nr:hypothetical protein KI387_008605 [Taxus chinensis]
MDKKSKSLGYNEISHSHNQGIFPKSSGFNGRFSLLHGEALNKILDPKSKKAIPIRRKPTTRLQAMEVGSSAPLFTVGHQTANVFASSGILHNAWEAVQGASIENMFVLKSYEGVPYAIFSSPCVEDFIVRDSKYGECKIQDENRAFSSCLKGNDDKPALVHKGALRRFLHILENSDFKTQMQRLINQKKEQAVVFVGHSMGGAVAALAMIWFLEKRARQISPLCITFGSPLVGDDRLGEAISREDWSGKFCHVVSMNDIVPRMLLAPVESFAEPLNTIFPLWGSIMLKAPTSVSHDLPFQETCKTLRNNVLQYTSTLANNYGRDSGIRSPYKPFGTYMFCSIYGAACIEDPEAVLKMLHFTMQSKERNTFDEIAGACISEHIDYGNMLECITKHLHNTITTRIAIPISDSFEMGIALQLEAMGIGAELKFVSIVCKQNDHALLALRKAGERKSKHDMKIEELNDKLSKKQSAMASLEWYKGHSKANDTGYYDSFKQHSDKKDFRANLYRNSLGTFWDEIVEMVEKHELPCIFRFLNKWINAATAYRRLVEPLDIADYSRNHKGNGSYLSEGVRPHRHFALEKWLKEKDQTRIGREKKPRTKFASLTEDSCFWAHVEEACKNLSYLQQVHAQHQMAHAQQLQDNLKQFEDYVGSMIKDKSISAEVFLEGSSFMKWWQQYRDLQLESPGWQASSPLFNFIENEKWK